MNNSKEPLYDHDGEEIINLYYHKVSKRFQIAKNITLLVLALYVFLMFWGFRDRITSENLGFLMRNINMDITARGDSGGRINYMVSDGAQIYKYKDSLVVLDGTQLTFFDKAGNITLSEKVDMENPTLAVSQSYALVYDLSNQKFYLYNAFSRIMSNEISGNIVSAGTSPAGAFILSLSKPGVNSEFLIYNNSQKLAASAKKSGYSACSAISNDGNLAMLVTYNYDSENRYEWTVDFIRCADGELISSVTKKGSMPLKAWYTDDGIPMLYTYDKVICFDIEGEIAKEVSIDSESIIRFTPQNSGFAMVYGKGFDRRISYVEWYDAKGALSGKTELDGVVGVVKTCGGALVCAREGVLTVIKDQKIANIDTSYEIVDVVDMKNGFFACGYSKAELILFEDLKFEEFVK